MYAPRSTIEHMLSVKDQSKVRSKVNQIYESLKEIETYQKRQKVIHMTLHENMFDFNNIYLQRRQLNIQDEDNIEYHSDDEEEKENKALLAENPGAAAGDQQAAAA